MLYWLDRSRRELMLKSPRRDSTVLGAFALRSPARPNPIGTGRARLVRLEGATVLVQGLNCCDGTPLIAFKPDRCVFPTLAPPQSGDFETKTV